MHVCGPALYCSVDYPSVVKSCTPCMEFYLLYIVSVRTVCDIYAVVQLPHTDVYTIQMSINQIGNTYHNNRKD